jgi:hypothetical protein
VTENFSDVHSMIKISDVDASDKIETKTESGTEEERSDQIEQTWKQMR